MHLRLSCFQCGPAVLQHPVNVEIQEAPVYRVHCTAGHESSHRLVNPKFEVLVEMALLAYGDGYTRETVATLAAAAEEFFRVFIQFALSTAAGGTYDLGTSKLFWKLVDRAEPQFGAFTALYTVRNGRVPAYPDKESIKFRNSVIHRGYIPAALEVSEYGDKLLRFLLREWREYKDDRQFNAAAEYQFSSRSVPEPTGAATLYFSALRQLLSVSGEAGFSDALELIGRGTFLQPNAT